MIEDSAPLSDLAPLAPLTRPVAGRVRRPGPWHARWWEAIAISLPALLMAVLAGGTWWLVRNTPLPEAAHGAAAPRHIPDYEMSSFSLQRFAPDGVARARVDGSALRHYPDTDTLEIDGPLVHGVEADGLVTSATAAQAHANGDLSQIELLGGARVLRESVAPAAGAPRLEFQGEYLHINTDTERVRSDKPVTLINGSNRLQAGSLDYDHMRNVVVLGGHVRGSMVLKSAGGSAAPASRP